MNIKILLEKWFSNPVEIHDTQFWVNFMKPNKWPPFNQKESPQDKPRNILAVKGEGIEIFVTTLKTSLEIYWLSKVRELKFLSPLCQKL